jgi:hypothetical protein
MLFSQTSIFFLVYFFLPCYTLRCTTNCSYTYNFTHPFDIPDRCNQSVLAGKCLASIGFSYDSQAYTVQFQADPSIYITSLDNIHRASMRLSSTSTVVFSYDVQYACKNTDDCARDLIRKTTVDTLQRQINTSALEKELIPLIVSPFPAPNNSTLNCYNSKANISHCNTSEERGLCIIAHFIETDSVLRTTVCGKWAQSPFVSMDQSDISARFDVNCNRSLCNDNSTLQTVKELMFKYKVTATSDGRLVDKGFNTNDGSKLMAFILLMIFSFILNYCSNAH